MNIKLDISYAKGAVVTPDNNHKLSLIAESGDSGSIKKLELAITKILSELNQYNK
jgi:hypothetical protein